LPDIQQLLEQLKTQRREGDAAGLSSIRQGRAIPSAQILQCHAPFGEPPAQSFPLFASRVPAGFPSPAEDYIDQRLDLHDHLIDHPAATFFVRVQGDSMKGAAILDGDLLGVDKAIEPSHGRIVITAVNGELTVKRLLLKADSPWLHPENPAYAPLKISEGLDCVIWGVVKHVIHAAVRYGLCAHRRQCLLRELRAGIQSRPKRSACGGALEQRWLRGGALQ
jgi:DNA polymerase V